MAKAKMCDRCGHYYDVNKTRGKHDRRKDNLVQVCAVNSNKEYDKLYDLCDECFKEFFKFIEGDENDV